MPWRLGWCRRVTVSGAVVMAAGVLVMAPVYPAAFRPTAQAELRRAPLNSAMKPRFRCGTSETLAAHLNPLVIGEALRPPVGEPV